jgi:DnaJ-class molecular chaperone
MMSLFPNKYNTEPMGFEKISGDEGKPEKEPCPECDGKPKEYKREHGEECDHCGGSGKDPYV